MPNFLAILEELKLPSPFLYAISDRHQFPNWSISHYLDSLMATSATAVQWREKGLSPAQNRLLIREATRLARKRGKLLLINSFWELAAREGADGAHLTSDQNLSAELRRWRQGRRFLVGKSVHSVAEALRAERQGFDYVQLGPVFEPLSKATDRRPIGLAALREAAQMLFIPVVAVGGIDEDRLKDVFSTQVIAAAGISFAKRQMERQAGAG